LLIYKRDYLSIEIRPPTNSTRLFAPVTLTLNR